MTKGADRGIDEMWGDRGMMECGEPAGMASIPSSTSVVRHPRVQLSGIQVEALP